MRLLHRYEFEPDPDYVLDVREQLTFKLFGFRLTFTRQLDVDTTVRANDFRETDTTVRGRPRR